MKLSKLARPERSNATVFYGDRETIGAATMLLHPFAQRRLKKMVLEGAPGQGKSTIAQYICQVQRMILLDKASDLTELPEEHRRGSARLPIKVDLRDFATWLRRINPFSPTAEALSPNPSPKSLESFLAALITHHSGGAEFTPSDLWAVSKLSPILLVLDGLDEVADIPMRHKVVEEIIRGVSRLEEIAESLQVVVTSRPAAFANSPGFPEKSFPHFELDSITRPLIDEYAEKWIKAKGLGARDRGDVKRILREKLDQPHLRDLARNPMQLTILLSLIHQRGSSLPDKRTNLYDNYVDLLFSREAEKTAVVRDHRDLLIDIHRHLAWILHSEAEQGRGRRSIDESRMKSLLNEYLRQENQEQTLVDDLFNGMSERVGALVARIQGTFEFDVQPLREYFAARYLYDTAPYSPAGAERKGTKPDRFDALARNFYWLNVTRFFAGCFSKGELAGLVDRLDDLPKDEMFRYTSHPRSLAAMLLSDWSFTQDQKSMHKVAQMVIEGLGLRYLLGEGSQRRRFSKPLTLPKKGGQEELVRHCFAVLRDEPLGAFGLELLDLINANSSETERQDLMQNPEKYPGYLVGCAEAVFRKEAASRMVAIGDIAQKEEWFSS